jgi:hypothetical protein
MPKCGTRGTRRAAAFQAKQKRHARDASHFGFSLNAGTTSVGFGDGRHQKTLPNFVPPALEPVKLVA